MKSIKKRCIFYVGAILILMSIVPFVASILGNTATATNIYWIMACITLLMFFAMLVDIGISIKNKHVQKKYIIYTSIFTIQFIAIALVSNFMYPAYEVLLALIGMNIFSLTLLVLCLDIIKSKRTTQAGTPYAYSTSPVLTFVLKVLVFFIIATLILMNSIFINNWL